jgi:hypothetical protein
MRKQQLVALAAVAVAVGIAVPASASASAGPSATSHGHHHGSPCAAGMHAAVVEDNAAYNARDARRYEAVLNPRMLFEQDGSVVYGRDAVMATARESFKVPGWVWTTKILTETVYGCDAGVAVVDAHSVNASAGTDKHIAVTMTMVREHGKWTVAMDTVHVLPS